MNSAPEKPRRAAGRLTRWWRPLAAVLGSLIVMLPGVGERRVAAQDDAGDPYRAPRERMVKNQIARDTAWGRIGVKDERVLEAMRTVPRHEFVHPDIRGHAYSDEPLSIGYGQTISQPYMVARMAELAEIDPEDRVLEVGTGSGYAAAVAGELGAEVHTVEPLAPLARRAEERLRNLGYANVHVHIGDGYEGWAEAAPYDAIVVTAAPAEVPPKLVGQLKPGGRMVIPVGPERKSQFLYVVSKDEEGAVTQEKIMGVRFVPMWRAGDAPGED